MLHNLVLAALLVPSALMAESAGKVSVEMDGQVVAVQQQPGCEISSDTASGVGFNFDTFTAGDESVESSVVNFSVVNCGNTVIKLTTVDEDPFASDNSTPENGLFAQHTSDATGNQTALNVDLSSDTAVFSAEGETINSDAERAEIDIVAAIVSDTSELDEGTVDAAASQFIYVYFSSGATGS